jgi:hypothetical protein
MIEYRIEDEFDIDVGPYWDMFFGDAYGTAMWPELDIDCKVVEFRREGSGETETIHRVQKLTPRREVPAILKRIVGNAIAYTETNDFVRAKSEMRTVTVPSFFADKVDTAGVYRVVAAGAGKCRRIWEAHCKCTVPLVGGKIERHIVEEVEESYRKATAFTRKFIAQHRA